MTAWKIYRLVLCVEGQLHLWLIGIQPKGPTKWKGMHLFPQNGDFSVTCFVIDITFYFVFDFQKNRTKKKAGNAALYILHEYTEIGLQ